MLIFTNTLQPIILQTKYFNIHYYGLFLSLAILLTLIISYFNIKKANLNTETLLDLFIYMIIGGLIGARIFHILFYNFQYFLKHPLEIILINKGGVSSHGLAIGLIVSLWLYKKIKKINLIQYLDKIVISLPIIIVAIRLGNFFNSEIVGRITTLPWAVKFPLYEQPAQPRHPSQIYEAGLGILIFIILILINKKIKKQPPLFLTNIFIFLYFSTRFFVEFFKEYQSLSPKYFLTMGQLLSLPFIVYSLIKLKLQLKKIRKQN